MNDFRLYWKEEEEIILRDWADKAQCYEVLHYKSYLKYKTKNTYYVVPVIIISTLTGTANFAQDRVGPEYQNAFVMATGSLSIIAAIVTTISQFLKISELNEGHRIASLSWGKFYRNIRTELAKHPLDRVNPIDMLKMLKEEFDRLVEISPNIPKNIIEEFNNKFKTNDISKPEICDIISPTPIFQISSEDRDKMINNILGKNDEIINIPSISDEKLEAERIMNDKINKFKNIYIKTHNRYPNDDEINNNFINLFKANDIDQDLTRIKNSSNITVGQIDQPNNSIDV